jgi:hypothetical protein
MPLIYMQSLILTCHICLSLSCAIAMSCLIAGMAGQSACPCLEHASLAWSGLALVSALVPMPLFMLHRGVCALCLCVLCLRNAMLRLTVRQAWVYGLYSGGVFFLVALICCSSLR